MEYLIEIQYPESEMTVTEEELADAYANLKGSGAPTITWNDGGSEVLIVAINDDDCVISLKSDETWYYLTNSSDEGTVPFDMAGAESDVPRKAVVPRELGLAALQQVGNLPALRTEFTWEEQ